MAQVAAFHISDTVLGEIALHLSTSDPLIDNSPMEEKEAKARLLMSLHGLDKNSVDFMFSLVPNIQEYSVEKIIKICAAVTNGCDKMKEINFADSAAQKEEIGFSEGLTVSKILSEQFFLINSGSHR